MSKRWNKVTIVGCGLIGASFALALRRSGACRRIAGWDSSASVLREALTQGIIDEVDRAFAEAETSASDLIYLAMPVMEIVSFLQRCGPQIRQGTVVTDAGSTKVQVCRAAREHLRSGQRFIGGHPVSGSHQTGLAHARAGLFENMPYVLIVEEGEGKNGALLAVRTALEEIGAQVKLMTAIEHDRAMALVSHLPQLLSSALETMVREQSDVNALRETAGAGYRDMTRLAASSWTIWREIFATNAAPLADALEACLMKLTDVRDELRLSAASNEAILAKTGALFENHPAN
jgi:prephenate dehydrogenase